VSRSLTAVKREGKQAMMAAAKSVVRAGEALTSGNVDDAVYALSRAIRADPGSRLARLVRGRAYFCKGMLGEAAADFDAVVSSGEGGRAKEDDLRARIVLGDAYHEAVTTFLKMKVFCVGSLSGSFHDPEAGAVTDMVRMCGHANRGRVGMAAGRYREAAEDFTEVIEGRGEKCDIPSMYFFRGIAYCKLHEWPAAVEDFSLNIALTPDDADAYVRRAAAHSALQSWDAALEDMRTALELEATPSAYAMKGRLLCCMRRFPEAALEYRRSLAMDGAYQPAVRGLREATLKHDPLPLVSQHNN